MSTEEQPSYQCENGELKLFWPTDKVYSIDTLELPVALQASLLERLHQSETKFLEIAIYGNNKLQVLLNLNNIF